MIHDKRPDDSQNVKTLSLYVCYSASKRGGAELAEMPEAADLFSTIPNLSAATISEKEGLMEISVSHALFIKSPIGSDQDLKMEGRDPRL